MTRQELLCMLSLHPPQSGCCITQPCWGSYLLERHSSCAITQHAIVLGAQSSSLPCILPNCPQTTEDPTPHCTTSTQPLAMMCCLSCWAANAVSLQFQHLAEDIKYIERHTCSCYAVHTLPDAYSSQDPLLQTAQGKGLLRSSFCKQEHI